MNEKELYERLGKIEKQVNYIQTDLKWLKKLIYLILIVLLGLNYIPIEVLGGVL